MIPTTARARSFAPMRLFLAIELPSTLIDDLAVALAPLRSESPELDWVATEKWHLTLKFFGEVGDERLESVVSLTDVVATSHRPFSMLLGGVGAFPNFRRARVLWIGVQQEARLELLQHDLELEGDAAGFELEGRAFRPHVTLARVRAPLEVDHVRRLRRTARRIDFTAAHAVSEITLLESTMAPTGAHYRRVHAAPLGPGGR